MGASLASVGWDGQFVALCFSTVTYPPVFTWVAVVSPWAPFHRFPLLGYLSAVVLASLAPATYLGVSFDIGPTRIFLPLCGGVREGGYFLLVAKCFIASSPPLAPLGGCFSASVFAGMPCFAQSSSHAPYEWHLLTLWSPESDLPSPPVPLSRAVG